MTRPIALQLYTLRDQLARDFEGTIRRVAEIGYAGVETAHFPAGVSPAAAKAQNPQARSQPSAIFT